MTDHYYAKQLVSVHADTTKAQNVDLLAADFQMGRGGTLCRITVATTNVALLLIPDEGTGMILGAGAAGTAVTYELALDPARTYNLQTNDAAGVTVYQLVVQEVSQ